MRILCLGDIYDFQGVKAVKKYISEHKGNYDIIIVNGENAYKGFGIDQDIADSLFSEGVDVITSGNHIFKNKSIIEYMKINKNILRPYNLKTDIGNGFVIIEKIVDKQIKRVAVVNIQGTVFMKDEVYSPFEKIERLINNELKDVDEIIVDFHAETTSEKIAMLHFLDGRVSILYGTHTHVQTNDAQISQKGTIYTTDIGMCGSHNGVIGVKKEIIVDRFLGQKRYNFIPALGHVMVHGISVEIAGNVKKISLIKELID